MAYACDICQRSIREPNALAVLRGWYGCEESRAATAKKEAEYRQVSLESEASLESHICLHCIETVLAKEIRLNAQKPRMVMYADRRKAFPKESKIESLRKTAFGTLDILCDRCEQSCRERYVELRSEWVDKGQAKKVSHVCSGCYDAYLVPQLSAGVAKTA